MKLNFIVTTLNGYIIERVEIGDYTKESSEAILEKLYSKEFTSKHIGEFNYIDDVAGNADDVDLFVKKRSSEECSFRKDESLPFYIQERFLLETVHNKNGYYTDFYVGLEVK